MAHLIHIGTLLIVLLTACGPATGTSPDAGTCPVEGPTWGRGGEWMLPGADCLSCHQADGHAETLFSVAGTVFEGKTCAAPVAGVVVHIHDSAGTNVDLPSNEVGNFLSQAPLVPPLTVSLERAGVVHTMKSKVQTGSCGSCHTAESGVGYVVAP